MLSKREWYKIETKRLNGDRVSEIAEDYGISRHTIYKHFKKSGGTVFRNTRLDNLIGKKYGLLTVESRAETSRNGHTKWCVICDCGVHKSVLATHLVSNKTNSCGCLRTRKPRNFMGIGLLPKTYFNSLLRGATGCKGRKMLKFDITMRYLWKLYCEQNGKCAYSGMPIDFKSNTASLDRIDSGVGYIKGNVQWLHKDINMMKRHYTEAYFKMLCLKVVRKTKIR